MRVAHKQLVAVYLQAEPGQNRVALIRVYVITKRLLARCCHHDLRQSSLHGAALIVESNLCLQNGVQAVGLVAYLFGLLRIAQVDSASPLSGVLKANNITTR